MIIFFILLFILYFYILSGRLFLKSKGLSNARVLSITKNEYAFEVNFLQRSMKSLNSMPDE